MPSLLYTESMKRIESERPCVYGATPNNTSLSYHTQAHLKFLSKGGHSVEKGIRMMIEGFETLLKGLARKPSLITDGEMLRLHLDLLKIVASDTNADLSIVRDVLHQALTEFYKTRVRA